ncbi:CotD family spore coat protein [Lysinibacillus sp. 54212]|uniref:CotD family spore coat protein n=1 Tax=Lysinibacillus sp. 54212 TaxID=3119829 RepID=UPI003FA60EEB
MVNRFWNGPSGNSNGFGMTQGGWGTAPGMGPGMAPGGWGTSPVRFPPQTFPTRYAPPQVAPRQEFVRTNIFPTVVPHIQPSHTTTVNRRVIENQFYFPHTESVVNECCVKNTMCGTPHMPCKCGRRR